MPILPKPLLLQFYMLLLALMLTLGLEAGLGIDLLTEVVVNQVVDKLDIFLQSPYPRSFLTTFFLSFFS